MNEPTFVPGEPNQEIIDAIFKIKGFVDGQQPGTHNIIEATGLYESLYRPTNQLKQLIQKLDNTQIASKEKGELLESIAAVTFACLKGFTGIDSYRSFDSQLDLVVTIPSAEPALIVLGLKGEIIIVESKNIEERVDVQYFERLCSILLTKFPDKGQLAIFFTINGATGFPKRNSQRKVTLEAARAVQILFHAFTKDKYVIVFDIDDIKQLTQPGALIRLVRSKIEEVEKSTGIVREYDGVWDKFDIPDYIANVLANNFDM